jgi:hypothetical protein
MSFIGSMFGGGSGAGWKASGADITNAATGDQADNSYDQTQSALAQQQAFVNAMGAQNGLGNQTSVYNQLQGVADGTGPNPAQAALANATAANTANQAALMAGQRGTGANAGLLARQAAMQGAANQQNSAGQAANMQANQSMNALGQMGGMANQMASQQAAGIQGLNQNSQNEQKNLLDAIAAQNKAKVDMKSNENTTNATIQAANQKSQSGGLGGMLGGLGSIAGTMFGPLGTMAGGALGNMAGQMLGGGGGDSGGGGGAGGMLGGLGSMLAAHGGQVPGNGPRSNAAKHLKSLPMPTADTGGALKSGGSVPGEAPVKGDSYKNDSVKALLSPGEIVLPRHVTQGPDAAEKAKAFVEAIMARKSKGSKK